MLFREYIINLSLLYKMHEHMVADYLESWSCIEDFIFKKLKV